MEDARLTVAEARHLLMEKHPIEPGAERASKAVCVFLLRRIGENVQRSHTGDGGERIGIVRTRVRNLPGTVP